MQQQQEGSPTLSAADGRQESASKISGSGHFGSGEQQQHTTATTYSDGNSRPYGTTYPSSVQTATTTTQYHGYPTSAESLEHQNQPGYSTTGGGAGSSSTTQYHSYATGGATTTTGGGGGYSDTRVVGTSYSNTLTPTQYQGYTAARHSSSDPPEHGTTGNGVTMQYNGYPTTGGMTTTESVGATPRIYGKGGSMLTGGLGTNRSYGVENSAASLSGLEYSIQNAINQGRIYSPAGGVYVPGSVALKNGLNTLYDAKTVPTFELPLSFQSSIVKATRGVTEFSGATNRSHLVIPHKKKACC